MSTVNDLLVEQVEKLKAENTKLIERVKTSESTNKKLRSENSELNTKFFSATDELRLLKALKAKFDKMSTLIELFKDVFDIANEEHSHDRQYKSYDD